MTLARRRRFLAGGGKGELERARRCRLTFLGGEARLEERLVSALDAE